MIVYGPVVFAESSHIRLVQPEAFADQPLQARAIEQVVGEFLVGEHGKGGTLGSSGQFGGFFHGEVRILSDDGHDHANHHLQATDFPREGRPCLELESWCLALPVGERSWCPLLLPR